jgi:hypothetical protein
LKLKKMLKWIGILKALEQIITIWE